MSQVVDSWRNEYGERVELLDNGRLQVVNAQGQPMRADNARRYDRSAPSTRSAVAQQIAAFEQEVKEHPGLRALVNEQTGAVVAMCLEPVPYWKK